MYHESFDLAVASYCLSWLSLHTVDTKWMQREIIFAAVGGPVISVGQEQLGITSALGRTRSERSMC